MIEVERKYRIHDKKAVEQTLIESGYTKSQPVHQIDKVFLIKTDSLKTFTTGDPVMRVRVQDGAASMTFKRAMNNADGDRVEHEVTVDSATEAEGMLRELGYKPVANVDKVRIEYKKDDITVVVDDVKTLGEFVEVEVVCQEGQQKQANQKVAATAKNLGLSDDDMLIEKYDQLISKNETINR